MAGIIVTHHPEQTVAATIESLVGQVAAVVVIDNGSSEGELAPVSRLEQAGAVAVIRNSRNLGLATAMNQGVAWAVERSYPWVVTVDDDTVARPFLIEQASAAYEYLAGRAAGRPIAAIGAGWADPDHSGDWPDVPAVPEVCLIQSGTLFSMSVMHEIGYFRDDMFVDFVDTEYCLRARAREFEVWRTNRVTIDHVIGLPTTHRSLLRTFTTKNHSPTRRYYITRNRIWVWRRYMRQEPQYVWFDMKEAAKELLKIMLAETDKPKKLHATLRGAYDGILGRLGADYGPGVS